MIRFTELLEKYLIHRRENPRPIPKGFNRWYRNLKNKKSCDTIIKKYQQ